MPVRTMYIDVDLTLVNDNLELYEGVPAKLEQWSEKYTLICWSHGGGDYAKRVCMRNKIDKYFKYFLDKPDILVDDNPELLTIFPAKIIINAPEDWKKGDVDLFRGARNRDDKKS